MRPTPFDLDELSLYAFGSRDFKYDDNEFPTVQPNPKRLGLEESVFLGGVSTSGDRNMLDTLRWTGFISGLADSDDSTTPRLRGRILRSGNFNFEILQNWLSVAWEKNWSMKID